MAATTRIIQLQNRFDAFVERVEERDDYVAEIVADHVVTAEEWEGYRARQRVIEADTEDIRNEMSIVSDAHTLAQVVLNAGAVTPWVERQTRTRAQDYLRLVERPQNIVDFPDGTEPQRAA
ncbi:MAG TPA: hypothetical protein VFQ54_01605 [Thermomicrobiales bacterium]|nr:hypothetical protein [Thermomicrobiales bacterium]